MSDTPFEIVKVKAVEPHLQADRLEVVKVLGTQFISGKGDFQPGDLCVYFPPDMLISESMGETLGVANYLKHSVYPGDLEKSRCRISAIRLRGVASFGFGIELADLDYILNPMKEGDDVTGLFGGEKYQPPEVGGGDSMRQPGAFHKYTTIQHYYRNESAILAGTPVRITEKIHGTNSRVGLVKDDGFEFMCGTHHRRVMPECKGRASLYWAPFTDDMREMLDFIAAAGYDNETDGVEHNDVIVFGEIYGNKIQPMDYGTARGKGYRVFDISVNGDYLNWDDVTLYCDMFGIETVVMLYCGPFRPELPEEYASGPTNLAEPDQIKCGFKGREGIVITPLIEQYSPVMNDRLILKAVSSDYYEAMK